jgi:hypothetical protein
MQSVAAASSPFAQVLLVFYLAILVFYVAAAWKVFVKAGEPGWGVLVPFYNLYLLCKISDRPGWWFILFFVPLVNIFIGFTIAMDIAKAFSKGSAFGIGLWLIGIIFVPILGFGPAEYTKQYSIESA